MDTCYLLVDVQEIRIQPYFCVKQGDYFFSLFLGHPVFVSYLTSSGKSTQFFREKRSRPWLENPKTDFNLQCREISREAQLHPSEAALATLPHYLHPSLPMEKSEVQTQYRNPFQV